MSFLLACSAVMGILALIFASILAIASIRFAVRRNPLEERIFQVLPHLNCGACGYGSCEAYAGAIALGKVAPDLCLPGGAAVAKAIGSIMGLEVKAREPKKAVLHCRGVGVRPRFDYEGIRDCRAAALLQGGPKGCYWGCIGLGTCAKVCPVEAITMTADNLPHVDEEKCIGCGNCARECPKGLFTVEPVSHLVQVLCSSHDPGRIVRHICNYSCIACRRCEKACPTGAIKVIDNLATIDYTKCTGCEKCIEVCPHNCIVSLKEKRKGKVENEALLESRA